jgi:hypothetical protein
LKDPVQPDWPAAQRRAQHRLGRGHKASVLPQRAARSPRVGREVRRSRRRPRPVASNRQAYRGSASPATRCFWCGAPVSRSIEDPREASVPRRTPGPVNLRQRSGP